MSVFGYYRPLVSTYNTKRTWCIHMTTNGMHLSNKIYMRECSLLVGLYIGGSRGGGVNPPGLLGGGACQYIKIPADLDPNSPPPL